METSQTRVSLSACLHWEAASTTVSQLLASSGQKATSWLPLPDFFSLSLSVFAWVFWFFLLSATCAWGSIRTVRECLWLRKWSMVRFAQMGCSHYTQVVWKETLQGAKPLQVFIFFVNFVVAVAVFFHTLTPHTHTLLWSITVTKSLQGCQRSN